MTTEKLPDEYYGKHIKHGGITKTIPRKWTSKEIDYIKDLKSKGLTNKEIGEICNRSEVSISIKLKRISKKEDNYNSKHRMDKYLFNEYFLSIIEPKSVLDAFSGAYSFYEDKVEYLETNDINKAFNTYHSMKADKLCKILNSKNVKFDLVDLDPFGSAFNCFINALGIAQKGIIITLGELGHVRFKRLDFVKKNYGIENLEDFTSENICNKLIQLASKNGKNLSLVFLRNYKHIARAYFKINN